MTEVFETIKQLANFHFEDKEHKEYRCSLHVDIQKSSYFYILDDIFIPVLSSLIYEYMNDHSLNLKFYYQKGELMCSIILNDNFCIISHNFPRMYTIVGFGLRFSCNTVGYCDMRLEFYSDMFNYVPIKSMKIGNVYNDKYYKTILMLNSNENRGLISKWLLNTGDIRIFLSRQFTNYIKIIDGSKYLLVSVHYMEISLFVLDEAELINLVNISHVFRDYYENKKIET